ncbi:cobalt-zinc-cadmium efflux system protein [Kitasatospora sp. GAS204A]|uniref:cation diffusion facilitator family transporter n=1 Tax=unclassified Kitasatospora TaxID=2633591 RepID=UPI0024733CCD|nr:cation diffusion facilitator family transporter [Kitasatospora sp. GAS204B]MDH6117556.1 cobalt-zinc-cadmium efflux system protein [Kitasatospora sp. GAS204B]
MAGHHDHPHDEHDAHDAPDAHGHGAHGHGHGAHGHSHGGHGHSHGVAADADRRWLTSALTLIVLFMAVEVVVGFAASSLALISDAAHMLTDAASIVLALIAMRLAAKPARGGFTYGLKRAEILSAQANGVTLLVLSAWLGYESIGRLINPPEVSGGLVLVTALVGIVVNLAAAWCMSKANRSSLNVEGAFQHVVTDLYAFIATAVAGAIMLTTGFGRADAIASLIVVVLMLRAGIGLVRDSGRIFLEAAPAGIDPNTLADRLVETPLVEEIHDLHVWEITSNQPALSAHILVTPGGDCHAIRRDLQRRLREEYRITHATLQVDHVGEDEDQQLLQITDAAEALAVEHCADSHGPVHRSGPHTH